MAVLWDNYFGCIAAMTTFIAVNVYSDGLSPPHFSCSSRPDGLCPSCDGRPDCFDLSDEISCDNWPRTVLVGRASDKCDAVRLECSREFLVPPPIPPFPICDKKDTSTPQRTTSDHIATKSTPIATYGTTNYDSHSWITSRQTFPPTFTRRPTFPPTFTSRPTFPPTRWISQTSIFATPQQWNELFLWWMLDLIK
ncbi:uncharacterized protein LOC127869679 [Dreissena polymorpha]|uniref:Uncharacterized protein n=1 Tax=Dreissena polymorpha TaxID=45954 RepID=A0A9D4LSA1_DREPO|nr:uncharacterized protein LOC127869679 [Dreissena polymorpha]KAH3864097.1 hypothetical protein DPMN_027111 [Dreissena polymorpha]